MTVGSLAYVVNDGLIRVATEDGLDVYQALFLRGCAMIFVFAVWAARRGSPPTRRDLSAPVLIRVGAEVVATALFFAALVHLPFANAQTILMLVPFAVTLVAAVMLGEPVGARRYALVIVGFAGVVAVVRPTPSQFSPWTLVVVAAAAALVVRELATRRVAVGTTSLPIAMVTAIAITSMTGALSLLRGWGSVTPRAAGVVALACACLVAGYVFAIRAVRVGDLSASAPFRYTSVVGAVVVGVAVFDEWPDALTLVGCALIVGAGTVAARGDTPMGGRRSASPAD